MIIMREIKIKNGVKRIAGTKASIVDNELTR